MTDSDEHSLEAEPAPQSGPRRRYLAVLFSDLSESARLVATMETEEYAELVAKLRLAYESVIPKHGGTIIQVVGDGLLASFGYPDAREDDGRRATEAALELHDVVRAFPRDVTGRTKSALSLHTGIHSGLVLLGEGDAVSGPIRLFGNAVNIAARLSDAAKPGEILVSKETLGAESHFFQIDSENTLKVQGIDDPVTVCRIIGRTLINTRFEARTKRGLTPFVGRETEINKLEQGLRLALDGSPQYLAIIAPPGLGKTRLVEEFLSRAPARDCRVFRGYCESYLSAEPMQPFLQMLRSLCGLHHGVSATLAAEAMQRTLHGVDPALAAYRSVLLRMLSLAPAAEKEAAGERHASESAAVAMSALFAALAATKPLILFIDDWQWTDDTSRQILGAIGDLEHLPIFVLLASRETAPDSVAMGDAQTIHLSPFGNDETERTIAQLLPGRDKFVVAEIREYSGGNPLFVEELCHSASRDQAVPRTGRTSAGEAWLDKLIEARVERLPPAQFDLVRAAAVIGNVVPARLLESITGCHAEHPLVQALSEQDLIYPGEQPGTLRFKHGIARDVIYAAVGLPVRKAMHKRIAETLKQQASLGAEEELYEPLAYHYAASGEAKEAASYAELAGDKAMAASALDRAQIQYRAALSALDLLEPSVSSYRRWMQIAQRLALASVFDPSREQLEVLLRAVALASANKDPYARAFAEYWAGYIYYALGEAGRAIVHLEIALEYAQRIADGPLVTQIRATLGQACAASCDYDKASTLLDEAIDIKRAHRKGNRPSVGLAYSLACKASVLGDRGHFQDAHECFEEALAAIRGAPHEVEGSILCWRAGVLLWQGRWDEASRCARKAQAVAERVKSLYLFAMSSSLGGYASWKAQRTPASLQGIADATSWLESRDRGLFISLNYGWLADGMVDSGQWQPARSHAARAIRRSRKQDWIGGAMTYRALARAAAAGQNRTPADPYLSLAMDNAHIRGSPHEIALTQLCAAEIRMDRGQKSDVVSLLDQAEPAFDAMNMPWHLDAVRRLRQHV